MRWDVLDLMLRCPQGTTAEQLATHFGVNVSTASRWLYEMREQGRVVRVAAGRSARWCLPLQERSVAAVLKAGVDAAADERKRKRRAKEYERRRQVRALTPRRPYKRATLDPVEVVHQTVVPAAGGFKPPRTRGVRSVFDLAQHMGLA